MMRPYSLIVLVCVFFFSCLDSGDSPVAQEEPPVVIPTTVATGPGGPAYMRGQLMDFLELNTPATNTHIYLVNKEDYADTLLQVFIRSTDGTFLITELPVDTVDIILSSDTFLSAKISSLALNTNENSFQNPGEQGSWVDSTLFLVAISDSVPRPNMPPFGILGYAASIAVRFDVGIQQEEAANILSFLAFDTLIVYEDSLNGILFDVILPQETISLTQARLEFLNWLQPVCEASPTIIVVTPSRIESKVYSNQTSRRYQ